MKLGFNYDYLPNLPGPREYDYFVADPDGRAHKNWTTLKESGTKFLAYLSLYEIGPTDPYLSTGTKLLKEARRRKISVLANNPRWKSKIMDVANPEWHALFLELVKDSVKKGYDGIYFDTFDAWGDVPGLKPKKRKELMAANVEILRTIKDTFPDLELMPNRGWEVLAACSNLANRLLVESVWSSHDGPISPNARNGIIRRIQGAQKLGYAVNVLDYVPSGDEEFAYEICLNASEVGCGCTVLEGSLTNPVTLAVSG